MTEKKPLPEIYFKNPLNLPLEKLYLKVRDVKSGKDDQIKAIDKFWVNERFYPCYVPIPENDSVEEREKWVTRAKNFKKCLKFILSLKFYKFWSYILYEPAIPEMLDSFLRNAVPCYLPQPSGGYEEEYRKIYNLVFRIYEKILTPKLSKSEYFTPKAIGRLLRDEQVITNFTLWDICKLYGHIDDGTLVNLVKYAYDTVPEIKDELLLTVTCMTEIFEAIGTAAYEEQSPTEKLVTKLTFLLFDTAMSINIFMKIYPPFKDVCLQEDLFSKIIHTYDSEVPLLYLLMKSVYLQDDNPGYGRVDNARVEMLETCHSLMSYCMDMIFQTSENPDEQNNWIETYLKLVGMVIVQHHFLTDFDNVYPISQDIEVLQAVCPNIDQEKCNSILSTVVKHQAQENAPKPLATPTVTQNGDQGLDEATVPEHILLESKISELTDMFPNLGDGFLEQCLINMNMDSQSVIMAILEENLPPHLAKLDRSLPRIPPELPGPSPSLEYFGKKPSDHQNFTELLNDKSHVKELKERLLTNYSLTTEDDLIYDDDYDDRYDDDFTVGIDHVDLEEVRKPRRRGQVSESEEEEEVAEESNATAKPRDAFCEDPALIRARREARYQQNRRGPPPQNKPKDVVGKPKGQGQDKQVLQNREKKNANKSSRANHNRRQGAQWKRSRGMVPF